MGSRNEDLGWLAPMLFGAIGVATFIAYALWPSFAEICPGKEVLSYCTRDWIAAWSGYVAAILATVAIIFQLRQSEAHRFKALQRENRQIADTLVIDLLEAIDRIRSLANPGDIHPPIGSLSRRMTADAVKVTPVLAIALHKFSGEIADLEQRAIRDFAVMQQLLPPTIAIRRTIAFRGHVLSYCFGVASSQIDARGEATGPFISRQELDRIQSLYGTQEDDLDYVSHVFETTGFL